MDDPGVVVTLMEAYPEFKEMYRQVYEICRNVEDVMGLFSKELLELDRNTAQYMIDEMQEEINQYKAQLEEERLLHQKALQKIQELEQKMPS